MKRYIEIKNANLHYQMNALRGRSFKEYIFNKFSRKFESYKDKIQDVHALKNISLTIKDGERVALIGANGAGKSTFLKALASIYPLSSGNINIKGKICPLFELSLGFEQEATGIENIRYRKLLLGDHPKEIKKKVKEIIEFSELGEFINYPIKSFSAGMLLRLAFSISTSIDGEILLLDEIISAGDAKFMKKAQQRISNVIKNSGIVIFASHDFSSIRKICNRAIYLQHGKILYDGNVNNAIDCYLNDIKKTEKKDQSKAR